MINYSSFNYKITMELSSFTIMSKDFKNGHVTYFKNMIFIKFNNKVYIEVSNALPLFVILPFDELMKHEQLKTYYELSLLAIGKSNIDPNYYGSVNPNYVPKNYKKNYDIYIDTIYIVEDTLTHKQEAMKGNCYHVINLQKLKNMKVSTDAKIEVFFTNYNIKYAFEEENFEERANNYTVIVNAL
jgi:hypothetical protein